ncbi:MAG: hypothetical protein ACD_30C00090G0010 [uncultured bacterium]|uniref:Phosphoribosylformylglycinamidine synthase subunit PurL n=3 Tax=Candidatus Daviesiibacteriota TaxID=1752718 RepID=A0A0G0ES93_9BACT|nr:MAG: hypothetical protein ACD_30C00090G0010 [uncultured bacterium]KKQ08367.1 MAG: Phosphoribosylformylglycinamidine synthase 2 [Candidatus Daviesbacteria bacterium GW2011_GWB1_36_5]KKQ16180.1 MAG: Phosphoribosylformylglycinamidine synthase 2 [Candidatus Daviesbacteria bacterium GW2011_GWA1_36_8]OGE33254.1 MAG: phosphoribosylformylglycinamidine synthase [Candidatus Daviesbacteria bacterium RIFCSPHIGHO2_02_FULL_37_9]OGE36156.1 MAG: phosphoribosylformylglycinamidine synthase [Candidatus Daviesb
MVVRIEVTSKVLDTRARVLKERLDSFGFKNILDISIADVYTIEKDFSKKQLKEIGQLLTNPVSQKFNINTDSALPNFSWAVEIGFLPGVTDNVANTTKEIIEDFFKDKLRDGDRVYTSRLIFINGKISKLEIIQITESLFNPLIQRVSIKKRDQFIKDSGMDQVVPEVKLNHEVKVCEVNLNITDEDLIKIGKSGIENEDGTRRGPLALDLQYMKTIQGYFKKLKRNPKDIEIESLAQTWSEHCKHTIFADPIDDIKDGLYKTFIKGATEKIRKKLGKKDFCVSVFTDNSGAIEFDKDFLITHKVETHNSPSALDPFGGAITGIGGVNRDTIGFGLGAKPVANVYGFCFADPSDTSSLFKDSKLTQKMLSPRRILDGVIAGINAGGNQSGIPTPQGFLYFDKSYKGKPLVFCGTLGIIPKKAGKRISHLKKAENGDYIVMVGGRVGLDGIHGATFSSEALSSGSPASAVQIGDPITQKKFSNAIVKEARDLNLYNSITDNGAGGLSCSVSEMAKESNGCEVNLEKVPLKYPGLDPWQIWISESQERMTLSVPKKNLERFLDLMKKRGVEATVIGKFTNSGKCQVRFKNKLKVDLDLEFLHNGLPKRNLKTKKPKLLKKKLVVNNLNYSSFEFVSNQYDHEVQGSSVLKPLQGRGRVNADASIIKPIFNSNKGVAISQALYPELTDINPYLMASYCIDEAVRNLVVVGANPQKIALLDNFCWCSSNDPERLWQLKESLKGCFDLATFYNTPFISGKDSMFNDFNGFNEKGRPVKISVLPTLLISSIGIVEDIEKAVSIDPKFSGDLIYLLGEHPKELLPKVNPKINQRIYQIYHQAADNGLISSGISITRGGLKEALIKMFLSGNLGLELNDNNTLNNLSSGRIIVTINPDLKIQFEKLFKGLPFKQIGTIQGDKLSIKGQETNLKSAEKLYKDSFRSF